MPRMRPRVSRPGQLAIGAAVAAAVIVSGRIQANDAREGTNGLAIRDCAQIARWTSYAADNALVPRMQRLAQSIEIEVPKILRENKP